MARRSTIENKINHERWLVSYADFITLLFAFFVVMYSVSQVNDTKYKQLSKTLQSTFSKNLVTADIQSDSTEAPLQNIRETILNDLKPLMEIGDAYVSGNKDWLEIELNANALFSSGSAELNEPANTILRDIADTLSLNTNEVRVSGHTDNIPISTDKFPNNWSLSSARAVAVVNQLAYQGVHPERLSAVGFGEFKPIADNQTEEGRQRNRRVVISVSSSAPAVEALGINSDVTTSNSEENAAQISSGEGVDDENDSVTAENTNDQSGLKPVILKDGSLLFSSDPELPRVNPVRSPNP